MTVYITANGPGEIAGWLRPVAAALKALEPGTRVIVLLLPCAFASGREREVAEATPGVDRVLPAKAFLSLWLSGVYKDVRMERGGALLHLGGDLMYAAALAARHGLRAYGYVWANPLFDGAFAGYLVKNDLDRRRLQRQRVDVGKIQVVGDLLVDGVRQRLNGSASSKPEARAGPGRPRIVLMPGSRLREITIMTPFFLEVIDQLRRLHPALSADLIVSPFLEPDAVQRAVTAAPDPAFGGTQGTLRADGSAVDSFEGSVLRLVREDQAQAMASADMVLSLPGTKTGEAACLQRPMIVMTPLNKAELIPWFGWVEFLARLPGIGWRLKRWVSGALAKSVGRVALPNILAGREVVPELMGVLTPGQVADRAAALLADPAALDAMQADLAALYAPFVGAADRVARILLEPAA